jgi:type III pantothenate kinase
MHLILDFGNTNKKIALADSHGIVSIADFQHKISVRDIRKFTKEHPGIDACILASVTRYSPTIRSYLEKRFRFIELTGNTPVPVKIRYRIPGELGVDRLAAAAGGAALFPDRDILIIIAGTCITYNLVTSRKEFIGGAISPGMQMRFQALHTFTGKLPLVSVKKFDDPLGRNTEQSVLSGVINGIVSEIEGFSALYKRKYPQLKVVFSGGDMNYFVKRLKISIFAVPNIVLTGLHQILRLNV